MWINHGSCFPKGKICRRSRKLCSGKNRCHWSLCQLSKPNNKDAQHPPEKFLELVWYKCKNLPLIYLNEFSRLYPEYSYLFE